MNTLVNEFFSAARWPGGGGGGGGGLAGGWWRLLVDGDLPQSYFLLSSQHLFIGVLDTVGCFVCQYKHTATCVNESIVNLWRGQAELYEWGGELLSPLQPIYATHIG